MAKKNGNQSNIINIVELDAETEKLRKQLAEIEEKKRQARDALMQKQRDAVANLPEYFGVTTMDEALTIIKSVTRGTKPGTGKRGRGSVISDETKDKIREALKTGEKTAKEIATDFAVSVPTVNNIKKAAGLVKQRVAA